MTLATHNYAHAKVKNVTQDLVKTHKKDFYIP